MPAARRSPPRYRSRPRDAIDLDVERAVPGQDADEAARWRIVREIARVHGIDRREIFGVDAIHIALDDIVEGRARRGQAKLDLLKLDLGLAFDRADV